MATPQPQAAARPDLKTPAVSLASLGSDLPFFTAYMARIFTPKTPVALGSTRATTQKPRGRKLSPASDPKKRHKCQICHNRFRRAEHLRRHHKSLHTFDRPFKCGVCRKVFSRADNLIQHGRTHASLNTPMELTNTSSSPLNLSDAIGSPSYRASSPSLLLILSDTSNSSLELSESN